jgi:hypothetical protein
MKLESCRRAAGIRQYAVALLCLAFVALLVSGCGSGTYSDRYDRRLSELRQVSRFSVLTHDPTDDLPVNFRVPKVFEKSYALNSEDPHDHGKHVAPQIVMPPFLYSPIGFRRTYEGMNADKKPFYLYVWMYDAERPKDASGGEDAVRNALRFKLNDKSADWQAVDADTPDGQTRKWKHLLLKGEQEFEIERSGNLQNERQDGIFDLWLYKTAGWDVMLGWRAPADVWDNLSVGDAKLKDLPVLVAGTIEAPTAGQRNTKPIAVETPPSFTPNIPSGGSDGEPAADQSSPAAAPTVKFTSRAYLMGNGTDSNLGFSASFPQSWIERFGVAYLPESVADHQIHDIIAFLRFPPDSRLGRLFSGGILDRIEKGSNVEAGTFEMGGKKGDYRLVRIDFGAGRRPELDGTYIVHFDNDTVVIILYGYADDADKFKTAVKSLIDTFRIESVSVGGGGGPPGTPATEPGRTYYGLTSKEPSHAFSFKFPDGWNQQGMSAVPLRAEADDSSDTLSLGVSDVPESISSQQLFAGATLFANFYNYVRVNGQVELHPVKVNDLDGISVTVEGESPAKFSHRKLIFYLVRKGPALVTFQGDFDASKFDATRPQFEEFAKSFRFENPVSTAAAPAAAAPASAPNVAESPATNPASHPVPPPGSNDASKPADASAPTGPAAPKPADASAPTRPAGTAPVDASAPTGPPASKPADASAPTVPAARPTDPSAPTTGAAAGASRPGVQPSDVAAAGPAGNAATPLKAGRVDLEFPEGITGSIEFPAGFQHAGKSPEASTASPTGAGAVAGAGDAPDTIKIEVKKLGQGVVYNELRKQTLSTDAPNGLAKTLEHGTCNVAGRSDAEFFVVAPDQLASPPAGGANQAPRRRIIYLANLQSKHLAVKITADVAEANYKSRKDELKACVKSLKFE